MEQLKEAKRDHGGLDRDTMSSDLKKTKSQLAEAEALNVQLRQDQRRQQQQLDELNAELVLVQTKLRRYERV